MVKSGGKWKMFIGEYNHNVDAKGRVSLPARFRDELSENFYITRGIDKCLFIYDEKEWSVMDQKIRGLRLTAKAARGFSRLFYSGAMELSCDKLGRITIPPQLRSFADIEKEVVIIGVSDRIEIWAKDEWDTYMNEDSMNYDDLTDRLEDFDIDL